MERPLLSDAQDCLLYFGSSTPNEIIFEKGMSNEVTTVVQSADCNNMSVVYFTRWIYAYRIMTLIEKHTIHTGFYQQSTWMRDWVWRSRSGNCNVCREYTYLTLTRLAFRNARYASLTLSVSISVSDCVYPNLPSLSLSPALFYYSNLSPIPEAAVTTRARGVQHATL